MTPLVIILILIGSGILIFSCFLIDNKENQNGEVYSNLAGPRELTIAEIEDTRKKVEAIISEITETSIDKTEDRLSQISNEKIIAVSDFSNQVIEKISQNHDEVIFLYNMVNEKETELKDLLKNIDKVKYQLKEAEKNEPVAANSTKSKSQPVQNNKSNAKTNSSKNNTIDKEDNMKAIENTDNLKQDFFNNNNQKILELYSQGFSVIDISKTLELGQGEVKLVIDLYNQK